MNSICFNERQELWTTRYDWAPTMSENINGTFYSIGGMNNEDSSNNKIWAHTVLPTKEINNPVEPTKWFGEQHVFEFEFVVNQPPGIQKIFENLQIISNNVQPKEMEITVIGDSFEFKRDVVDLKSSREWNLAVGDSDQSTVTTTSNTHGKKDGAVNLNNPRGVYHWDRRLNQSVITKWQPFKDIYSYGRRIGNIQYKNDSWVAQIEPLLINPRKEARIRDKWARIRIRYSGEDLAVIAAINTIINV
jgi:hypothetical protein